MRKGSIAGLLGLVVVGGWALVRRADAFESRVGRTARLARVGGRVGRRTALHKARRVFASAERRVELDREHELRTAEDVAGALGNMKGAMMKFGQLASFLDSGLPEPMREALATLQQDAPPMSGELAAEVVEQELGSSVDRLFERWDPVPFAAASIGQVHRAITRDGRAVAVKVQYPGVDAAIGADLANTALLTQAMGLMFPGFEPGPVVAELKARIMEELDYRLEAQNQRAFAAFYEGHPFIHVPAVVDELCASRVLTTELAEGVRFSVVASEWPQEERDLAGEAVYRYVFRSLYRMRAFNGDPHPGNYLFQAGGRVTFLDYGLVKHFDAPEIAVFEEMIHAIVLAPDKAEFRRICERVGTLMPNAPLTDDEVVEYFGHYYDLLADEVRAVTHEYASETVQQLLVPSAVSKWANLPPAFVIIQRINLGLYAILAELGSRRNWLRIARELWPSTDDAPSTELGRQEAAWLATRR
ncbi:MAG: AarF/ABC1/UbiB kinase family protein [Actinomycetota bacterium]|nr:AarF/ABC1/UbiB kinase family protein [Actinomycetota bacterium]